MIKLEDSFYELCKGVEEGLPRFEILDHQHVLDQLTNVEYHLYTDEPYKVTYKGEKIIDGSQMTPSEARLLDKVKTLIYRKHSEISRRKLYDILNDVYEDIKEDGMELTTDNPGKSKNGGY